MKILNKSLLCLCLTAMAHAYTTDQTEERPQVGERCTYESLMEFRTQCALEDAENMERIDQIPEEERPEACDGCDKRIEAGWLFNPTLTHPGAIHIALNISPKGDTIELEDGSIWSTSHKDRSKTVDWLPSDVLTLTPNHSWFSNYGYRFTNQTTGSSIEVEITLGPVLGNMTTHRIFAIDNNKGTITLYDGSVWDMSWFDREVVSKFMVNDIVILGTNDGWWKSFNPQIMFNISTLKHARCSRTQ